MNDKRLMVPINVEALAVGKDTRTEWMNLKPDFRGIYRGNQVLGQQLAQPFSPSTGLHQPGIHLHWALPDGLTHGATQNNGGQPEFPCIPNRWLVARFWDQGRESEKLDLRYKAWIIESDTVTDNTSAAVWPTLTSAKLEKKEDYYVFVGKHWELSQWPGETSAPGVDITAIGYGEPAFSAYYPACKGILGFHDKDLKDLEDVSLTYLVAGWYSAPSKDPLHQSFRNEIDDDLSTKLEQLREVSVFLGRDLSAGMKRFFRLDDFLEKTQWMYPGFDETQARVNRAKDLAVDLKNLNEARVLFEKAQEEKQIDNSSAIEALGKKIAALKKELQSCSAANADLQINLPTHILCHGIITGIHWKETPDSGVPRDKPHRISVGNTAVDALAALFEKQCGAEFAKLLSVFQYDLLSELEKPGGDSIVDDKVHERAYAKLAHGIRWDLLQDSQPGFSSIPEDGAPPIPGDVRTLLEQLNRYQRRINQLKREQESLRSELYASWYKKVLNTRVKKKEVDEEKLNNRIKALQQDIARVATEIAELDVERGPKSIARNEIQAKLETFLPGWKVQQFDEPEFWRPNDPVVLMAGESFQRSQRHGEDGRYRSDGRLLCRLSGQEITGIKVKIPYAKGNRDVEFGRTDIDHWLPPFASLEDPPFPKEVVNLFRESLMLTLDKKRALAIVTEAYEKNEKGLAEKHKSEIEPLPNKLLEYLKKVWEKACDPEVENPKLRYPETDTAGQAKWELVGTFPSPIMKNDWKGNPWLPLFLQWQVGYEPAYTDTLQALDSWELTGLGTAFKWTGKNSARQDQVIYCGTTLLTPSSTLQLSDRLRQYNLTHENDKLRTFQTAVRSMNVLCQSLGGLTEQFLMRKSLLELRPLEPARGKAPPQFSPIYDAVKDVDWLSPLVDGRFLPVRSGQLKLQKLWIIDAFGQLLKLEDLKEGEKNREGTLFNPLLPERLRGPDGSIRLEPRLAQPARFTIGWPPAGCWGAKGGTGSHQQEEQELDPICGWVVPNFLDKGLMIYDARGYALGALQAVQRKSWKDGVGAQREPIESFHWVDIPGSEDFFFGKSPKENPDPLGEKADPHLRGFVNGLLSLTEGSGQAFSDLLDKMNEAFSAGGAGSGHNPNLALLIGRPLALVRASLRLEVDGCLACAQGWDTVQREQTGGIEKVKFPIRLGDCRSWKGVLLGNDGLVGFFRDKDYTRFYPAFGLRGRTDDKYNKYCWAADPADRDDTSCLNNLPKISIGEPLDLTLLMDPARGICVTSGILPRTIFHLPYGDVAETLENKQVVFFTGPLVSPENEKEIRMPQPSDIYGQWSWTHHPEVKVWRDESIADVQKEQGRFSETPLQITEGWLKLTTAPLSIRVFTVIGKNPLREENEPESATEPAKPERFEVMPTTEEKIVLTWSVTGAEKIELLEEESCLFESHRHPLPTQYTIQVERNTTFTLIATGRSEKASGIKEPKPQTVSKTINITVKGA